MKIKPSDRQPTFSSREQAIEHCRNSFKNKVEEIDTELDRYEQFKNEPFYKDLEKFKKDLLKAIENLN